MAANCADADVGVFVEVVVEPVAVLLVPSDVGICDDAGGIMASVGGFFDVERKIWEL